MRSDDGAVTSLGDRIPIYEIGRRVLLTVERPSGNASKTDLGGARSVDITVGNHVFRLHQMPENTMPPTAPEPIHDDIAALPSLLSIGAGEWHGFLRNLFGMAVSVLRLASDDKFISVVTRMLGAANRQTQMQLHQIAGSKAKVAVISSRSSLALDDLIVFFGDTKLLVGRVEIANAVLMHPKSREKVALINCPGNVTASTAMLLSAKGISRVEVDANTHGDLEEFYSKHERSNFDLVSMLAQSLDEGALIHREGTRLPSRFHDQRLDIQFEVIKGISLENGFFASGWFFDQEDQIAEVVVIDHSLEDADLLTSSKLFNGRIELDSKVEAVRRFVAFIPRSTGRRPPEEIRVRVTLKNGLSFLLAPERIGLDTLRKRDALLESIASYSFSLDQFNDIYKPAIQPLQRRLNSLQRVREKREFGNRSARSNSIVIPIYREMNFLRSQLMAFALDPFIREQCEIIYCIDDPLTAQPFISAASAYSAAFPLDVKVIVLDRNGGYGLANNFAVEHAAGPNLVLLNSDIVPTRPGWVEAGVDSLATLPRYSVVGPKLLYPDGCIQHAGMYFQRTANQFWQNIHFSKGYGRELPSANISRKVPAVTGACMFIKKSDFLEVAGFCDDYIVGDFEDSDLCLKLRNKGGVAYYHASIELYHFERQSMNVKSKEVGSATTLYNEALHTSKWDSLIPLANEVSIAYGSESQLDQDSAPMMVLSIR